MKRKISLILSVLCLFVLMVALASCGHEHAYSDKWTNDANNHWHVCDVEGDECSEVSGKAAHTFQEKSRVEATCTAVGELTEACSVCGYEKKTEIPMVAHDYADETCTAPKTCVNCSATDGEALGHDEQYQVIDPTCTEDGYTAITCSRCDYTSTKDTVDALGHDEQYGVVPPTCTVAGITNITCSRCDYTNTKDPVDALGHDEQYEVVAPTCTVAGITNITCSRCDYTSTKDPVDALGHDEQYEVIDPTCLATGITNITCSRCDYTNTKDVTDALGHTGGEASCTVLAVCTRCEESYGELAPHTYYTEADAVVDEHYVITLAATCTENGTYAYKCTVCQAVSEDEEYIVVIPALGHKSEEGKCRCGIVYSSVTLEGVEKAEASHEGAGSGNLDKLFDGDKTTTGLWNDGNKEYWPSAVGDSMTIVLKSEVYTDEIAFWICGNWTSATVVFYDAEGNEVARADVLYSGGDTGGGNSAANYVRFDKDIKFKSMTLTSASIKWDSGRTQKLSEIEIFVKSCPDHAWIDATCLEVKHCGLCGLTEGELADHVYKTEDAVEGVDYEITTAPTCVTEGVKTYKCQVCAELATDADYIVAVDKIDHNYDVKGDTTAPTCITKGYTTYSCSAGACGTTEQRDYVDEIAHNYTIAGEVVDPTCSAEGYTVYSCSAGACGTTTNKDFTDRTAHNLVELNEYGEVSCLECGATYRNITTIVTVGSGELCLDCGKEVCDCNVNVEWSGYVKPSAPEAITAGVAFTKNSIPEKEDKALEIGGGLIRLESAEETTYTIVIGDSTITVTGTIVVVDLYKFESVASVTITAEADATVSFYEKI